MGGVNDELTVSAHGNEAAVAVVFEHLGVQLARTQVTGNDGKALTIREGIVVIARSAGKAADGGRLDVVVGRPYDLAGGIHRGDGVVATELDADASLIEANGKHVGLLGSSQGPGTLHTVVEGRLGTVGGGLPKANGSVLGGRSDEGKLGMEHNGTNIVRVPFKGVDDGFGLWRYQHIHSPG